MFLDILFFLWPFFILVILIVFIRLFFQRKFNQIKSSNKTIKRDCNYVPVGFLFTPTEIHFLKVLESITGTDYKVFGKVRISDLLKPDVNRWEKGTNWHWLFSQISQKHVDYVLTDNDYNVLCAIELNDSSHEKADRIKRDDFVDKAFKSAGIPLVWVKADSKYLESELSKSIAEIIISVSND